MARRDFQNLDAEFRYYEVERHCRVAAEATTCEECLILHFMGLILRIEVLLLSVTFGMSIMYDDTTTLFIKI